MTEQPLPKKSLRLLLAAPRGFCAGVDRAIQIVELALKQHGAPVYVRHEIVHNRYVVDSLKAKGAVFVEELDEVPDGGHVVFSAHGVPKSVPANAQQRRLAYFDATRSAPQWAAATDSTDCTNNLPDLERILPRLTGEPQWAADCGPRAKLCTVPRRPYLDRLPHLGPRSW